MYGLTLNNADSAEPAAEKIYLPTKGACAYPVKNAQGWKHERQFGLYS